MIGIGIDIGGTNVKLGAFTGEGRALAERRFKTESGRGRADFIKRLSRAALELKDSLVGRAVSVGIGMAGDMDPDAGAARFSPNLCGWRGLQVSGPLEKALKLPCFLENDANMAAWGAYASELKGSGGSAIAVTLGTGVGGGIILDGKLYHGAHGSAGEIGHFVIRPGGARCGCGQRGCLEAYCGSGAVMAAARALVKDEESFVRKYADPARPRFNTVCLARAARAGNAAARKVWRDMGESLGMGLAGAVLLFNPEHIILTGGVSRAADCFLPATRKVFAGQSIATPFKRVKVRVARSADLGVLGAALYGLHRAAGR
ncbi:MAG: ROK family protein [Elusimicrobiales bacterium]|nr:ROK family protein [Elusimicrobiales bacterium]